MFLNEHRGIVIEDVLKMDWDPTCSDVLPRPMDSLSFRRKGNCVISDDKSKFHLKTGDILFLPKQKAYNISSESESITVVHFDLSGEPMPDIEKFSFENCDAAERIFDEMYRIFSEKEVGYYYKTLSLLYTLFELLEAEDESVELSKKRQILRPAINYLNEHFTDYDFSVKAMEEKCHYSEAYFRRLFSECFGKPPVEYLISKRLKLACAYLKSGNYSVKTVAEKCGFEDSKYFSVLFKKRLGQSPLKYKMSH